MNSPHRAKLEQIGLSAPEARVYLALLHHGPLAAAGIAAQTGITRTSVYPTLCSLADKGLVEGGLGHGSRFAAVSPGEALPALIVRDKEAVSERERIAAELVETLGPIAVEDESALDDTVQVLRTPQLISERFQRLEFEARREIQLVTKAPILSPTVANPGEEKALRRGVRYRCLYERAVLENPIVKATLQKWIAAGEEARVYDGELPYKYAVFDGEVVMLTLVRRSGQTSAMLVRHAPFAKSIGMLFDSFWKDAEPLVLAGANKRASRRVRSRATSRSSPAGPADDKSRNHAASRA